MADININLNQGYDDLLLNIVDRISTGVYRAKSLRMQQENSAFYKGLARDRQNLDLLSNIDKNYDPNDPANIERVIGQVEKIKVGKHLQATQNLLLDKYKARLPAAQERRHVLSEIDSLEKNISKIREGDFLEKDNEFIKSLESFIDTDFTASDSEVNQVIQDSIKSTQKFLQLHSLLGGMDVDKKKEGFQVPTNFGEINITAPEYEEVRFLIAEAEREYRLSNDETASEELEKAVKETAEIYQTEIARKDLKTYSYQGEVAIFDPRHPEDITKLQIGGGRNLAFYKSQYKAYNALLSDPFGITDEEIGNATKARDFYGNKLKELGVDVFSPETIEEIKPKIEGF